MVQPGDIVSAQRVMTAPAAQIFEVIADPRRHPEFDGSGSVRKVRAGAPDRLSKGASFTMEMKRGLHYAMVNTVVEFEEGRSIAWAPKPANGRGARFFGRIWRYELEPVDNGTLVRETWDISHEAVRLVLRHVSSGRFRQDMVKSLQLLDDLVAHQS